MMNRFTFLALPFLALPLTACGGGDDDAAAEQPSPWSGHTYYLNIAKKSWTTPRPVGTDLFGVAPAFVFKITGTASHLSATMATAAPTRSANDPNDPSKVEQIPVEDAVQDMCGPTQELSLSPSGEMTPDLVRMHVLNTAPDTPVQTTGDVFGFKLSGVLPNGDTPSTTGTLDATMDFRQLYVLFDSLGGSRTPQIVCDTLSGQYTTDACKQSGDPSCVVACTPCPNDGEPLCLSVKAEDIGAIEAPNFTITEVPDEGRPESCADTVLP